MNEAKIEPMIYIRWTLRADLAKVLEIESEHPNSSWSEEKCIRAYRQRNSIGMVAEMNGTIAGSMIYELHREKIVVVEFAVASASRRQGIGKAMIEKLKGKLTSQRRHRIVFDVPENNLAVQCFLKANDFKVVAILKPNDTNQQQTNYRFLYFYEECNYIPPSWAQITANQTNH